MLNFIVHAFITTMGILLGGIANMVFTKTSFYKKHNRPIDGGKKLKDGKRVFGDNKTWVGFVSMILFCIITQIFIGFLCAIFGINHYNDLYIGINNTIINNALLGCLFGFTYMLFELPNSFIKRRLDIQPGKTKKSGVGWLFFIVDQIDSLIGIGLMMILVCKIPVLTTIGYIIFGAGLHVCTNMILYTLKIRKNL